MKKLWEKIEKHPVVSGVTVMLIGTVLLKLADKFLSLNIFSSIFTIFIGKYIISMWGLVIIGIVPVALFVGFIFFSGKRIVSFPKRPDWLSYTEDIVFKVLWQWKYRWDGIESIDNLIPLCPNCKRELAKEESYDVCSRKTRVTLYCVRGDFKEKFPDDYYQVDQRVIREIQGRIRNGEYKGKIKKR